MNKDEYIIRLMRLSDDLRKRGTSRQPMSVRLSVCVSHSCIIQRAEDITSVFLGQIAPLFYYLVIAVIL